VAGINEVVRRFGEESRPVAELHIKEDWHRYCGFYGIPTLREIDLDDWLFLNEMTHRATDDLISEVFTEKL
jgi:hypothetical protein